MLYPAHIKLDTHGPPLVQTVEEHCRNCAKYAAESSISGLKETAYLAGLLHDMGKYTFAFKAYIEKAANGEEVRRGSVNHTFAGVRFVLERWHEKTRSMLSTVSELLAFAIGAHHGLFDCVGENGENGFRHRLEKEDIHYKEVMKNFQESGISLKELDALFDAAQKEFAAILSLHKYKMKRSEGAFVFSLLARLLSSAVIDADRRDTVEFMYDVNTKGTAATAELWQNCLRTVEEQLSEFPQQSELDKARSQISAQCRAAAGFADGIYRLSVPTGGGKTLASLRYSLAAAAEHGKRRIVFVTPLLSVLEQNAAVLRNFIGNDSLILEHHSNVIQEEAEGDEADRSQLLMESWDAPIIITTLVQLLNTLFSGKTACIRRMSALADSIIVIDEVQSVPGNMLSLFNMAMNFLAVVCNTTIVLCSATHPCLETVKHGLRFSEPPDLVPYDPKLWQVFARTQIIDKRTKGGYSMEELADFATECAQQAGNLLLICNKKSEALSLYQMVSAQTEAQVFHLSTSMCVEHRTDTLQEINSCLDAQKPIICISTQLVEAGVDFSFACVIRVLAGMDNIVQAAGRCNRNGEYDSLRPVYIVNIKQEDLSHLQEIKQAQSATEGVLEIFRSAPADLGDSLSGVQSINKYYTKLYSSLSEDKPDYPLRPKIDTTIFELLSTNPQFTAHSEGDDIYTFTQAFRTAGENFKVFEDNTTDVLVPYGKGSEIIADLCSERANYDFEFCKTKLEEAKRFTISLYEYEIRGLGEKGGIQEKWDGNILVLTPDFYSPEIGVSKEGDHYDFICT